MHSTSSLTRIFKRLRTHGKLDLPEGTPKESPQGEIVTWLNERHQDFVATLVSLVASEKLNVILRVILEADCS